MKPDKMRELDKWIAEHVMEWPREKIYEGYAYYTASGALTGFNVYPPPAAWAECDNNYWGPTLNYKCALMVLEKCAEKLDTAEGMSVNIGKSGDSWEVCDMFMGHGYESVNAATADTLPLAICLLAVKLFGGEPRE